MVTGVRRGELCGLRWRNVDVDAGVLTPECSIGQRNGRTWEKDTKTHQHRRIALDPETVEVLSEHRRRCTARAAALDVELADDTFVFSLAPDGSTHLLPDSVSQRYGKLAKRLGLRTSIHKLRHYSATELIAAWRPQPRASFPSRTKGGWPNSPRNRRSSERFRADGRLLSAVRHCTAPGRS
jgi:integrase